MNENLNTAIRAAIEAGKAIMNVYEAEITVQIKTDKSPLTKADTAANAIINRFLRPTGIPIISEENRQLPFSERKSWSHCWIVDPLDGTKEFIKRNGEFTVNIAYVVNGEPTLGVIYVPALKQLYFADVHLKSALKIQIEDHRADIQRITNEARAIVPKINSGQHIEIVGSRSHMSEETLAFVENLKEIGKTVEIVSKGSSLKFCLVAEGMADIYPRFAPTMEWDTAAGQAICNAVGIAVISEETKQSLTYNKESLLNPWFIVSKPE